MPEETQLTPGATSISYTPPSCKEPCVIFEHLIDPDFTVIPDAEPGELVDAQVRTVDFLADDESPLPPRPRDRALAQQAFTSLLGGASPEATKESILQLKTPSAVQHHVAMLTQYDWDFVEQAKEIRGYVVSSIMNLTTHADARIKLRALELLGKVTEVASFTERSEIIHKQEGASEIEDRLRAKLQSLLPKTLEVETVELKNNDA